jgi:isocitrate dehydrogenase (NAD+)
MLRHIGENAIADRISRALGQVLGDDQIRTRDLGGTATTAEFAAAVCRRLSA